MQSVAISRSSWYYFGMVKQSRTRVRQREKTGGPEPISATGRASGARRKTWGEFFYSKRL
jgi:hypothetical protein